MSIHKFIFVVCCRDTTIFFFLFFYFCPPSRCFIFYFFHYVRLSKVWHRRWTLDSISESNLMTIEDRRLARRKVTDFLMCFSFYVFLIDFQIIQCVAVCFAVMAAQRRSVSSETCCESDGWIDSHFSLLSDIRKISVCPTLMMSFSRIFLKTHWKHHLRRNWKEFFSSRLSHADILYIFFH